MHGSAPLPRERPLALDRDLHAVGLEVDEPSSPINSFETLHSLVPQQPGRDAL